MVYYPSREPEHIFPQPANGQEGGREYRDSGDKATRVGQFAYVEPIKGCVGFEAMIAFYRELAESKAKRSPAKKLAPVRTHGNKTTLESVLRGIQQ